MKINTKVKSNLNVHIQIHKIIHQVKLFQKTATIIKLMLIKKMNANSYDHHQIKAIKIMQPCCEEKSWIEERV
jgi:cell fate (sporulation/competence/biofilm development) regulator YmcA (YheA/YmcA/DUF963 family)